MKATACRDGKYLHSYTDSKRIHQRNATYRECGVLIHANLVTETDITAHWAQSLTRRDQNYADAQCTSIILTQYRNNMTRTDNILPRVSV